MYVYNIYYMNPKDRMIKIKYVDINNGNYVNITDDIYNRLLIQNIPPKNSASNSIIIQGLLQLNPPVNIYGKYFKNDQHGLVFERGIYDYIKTVPNIIVHGYNVVNITNVRNDHIIFEYESHELDRAKKLSYASGVNRYTIGYSLRLYNDLNTVIKANNITADDPLIGFITISYPNSQSVMSCFYNYWGKQHADGGANWEDHNVVSQFYKFMFNLLYNIYLLNIKFDIIHNDCHFGNMLVQDLGEDPHNWKPVNYILNENFFTITQRFIIRIYDFDFATKIDVNVHRNTPNRIGVQHNNFLNQPIQTQQNLSHCENNGMCNHNTQIDSNIIIASITRLIKLGQGQLIPNLLGSLIEIRDVLLENHTGLKNAYNTSSDSTQPGMFWCGLCKYDNTTGLFIPPLPDKSITCTNTDISFIDIRLVLSRYINRYPIINDSGVLLNSLYNIFHFGGNMKQKYLKYKYKYLNLKKKLNK
jgi:hypothetical protein